MYPLALLEGQGMGTAYEYYSKMRVMRGVFARTTVPRSMIAVGLPEKHGYDLDFVMLARQLRCPLLVCEDRPAVLQEFRTTLQRLPDLGTHARVQTASLENLADWRTPTGDRFDWVISTASVQRLSDREIVAYIRSAARIADYALLFVPNGDNRAHVSLSGLKGLSLDHVVTLCHQAANTDDPDSLGTDTSHAVRDRARVVAAGYCDIPPFPPGLERSQEAKENAMHSPLETLAMQALEWWCRGEAYLPRLVKHRYAHLVYVALDLRERGV
jgi:hypothetical protein